MEMNSFYRQYQPSGVLTAFVECYWVWQGLALPARTERLIPGGRVEMIFNLGDGIQWLMDGAGDPGCVLSGAHIMGQRDRVFFCRPQGQIRLLGVRFRPGCFAAFSPIPLHLLLNQLVPAADLFGPAVGDWHQRLGALAEDDERIGLLDLLLYRALAGSASIPVLAALATLRRVDGVSVESICEGAGWGYKRMERAFLREVGYTPKTYSRVVRFNKAIRRMGGPASLTTVGHVCGYYDQAHFIKDFSHFAGMTPGQFRLEENSVAEFLIRHQAV